MNWHLEIELELLRVEREAIVRADAAVTARQAADCLGLDYPTARERRAQVRQRRAA